METSNLLDTEFKTLVIRMLNKPRGRVDQPNENFNKEIGNKQKKKIKREKKT